MSRSKTAKIFTIGYSGFNALAFLSELQANGVNCLVDTREIPISRKKGFSKTGLALYLEQHKIQYHHFRQLGSPRIYRHAVRESGDYATFFSRVREHLSQPAGVAAIHEVAGLAMKKSVCLMCCCADWTLCHRSCVVEHLADTISCLAVHLKASERQSRAA